MPVFKIEFSGKQGNRRVAVIRAPNASKARAVLVNKYGVDKNQRMKITTKGK